jgi:hypothetical protein
MRAAAALLCAFALGACQRQVTEVPGGTLASDAVWSGTVIVAGDVDVPPGVTLTILPGTTVKFRRIDEKSPKNLFGTDSPYYPGAELIVRGRILAQGTADDIIVFTSAERDALVADWGAINLLGSEGNVLEYCKFLFAYTAIHAHGAQALVSHNEFLRNGVAISFKKETELPTAAWAGREADLTITHNHIHDNKGGVNLRSSRAVIAYNQISDNKLYGLWLKEQTRALVAFNEISGSEKNVFLYQASGARLRFNNLGDAKRYAIAVAEEQEADVDASQNWFGTQNPAAIDRLLFDKEDDPALGKIVFEPLLKERVKGAGR